MSSQHRKLIPDSSNQTYNYICGDCYGSCLSSCYKSCPDLCPPSNPYLYPPPSPGSDQSSSHPKPPSTLFMILTFTVLFTAFMFFSSYVYVRRYRRRRRSDADARRRSLLPETTETVDEDHGPIVDHPIWYINTVGLQPSTINSIAVCKYKSGEGLVEGTECSVCLNEFGEDETLRLLPKCSHAFHLPCIDTWLRSHTNCPLCRAPIVFNKADRGPSSSSAVVNNEDSGVSDEETQAVVMENGGEPERESDREEEEAVEDERRRGQSWGIDEDVIQPMRRSVSLDSIAASQISHDQALIANGINPEGSNGNLDNESDKGKESSLRIVSRRRSAGNQRLLRLMRHSSIGKSLQNRPIFMKRSFSCNGKLFSLPISNNKSRNTTNPPMRSF